MTYRSFAFKATLFIAATTALSATASAGAGPLVAGATAQDPASQAVVPLALSRIDFSTGTMTLWPSNPAARLGGTLGDIGSDAGERLALPQVGPNLPVKGSRFSSVMRARDFFDLEAYPARVVAKLYRLNDEGKRQGTACTAQFIGPRHLLTAAHCLIDRSAGEPYPGFQIALRHDGGRDHGVLPVTVAWVPTGETTPRPSVIHATTAIDWAADCHDVALIEVDNPVGRQLGWLGMSTTATPDRILHRFSYPNESTAVLAQRRLDTDEQRDADTLKWEQEYIAGVRLTEPDFSPDNLYYEFGPADQIHDEAVSERNGAILPGRSGSALIYGNGQAVGVMSRAVEGVNYSCRLTPEVIGAFALIAQLESTSD